jgi:hypothetical protein
MDVFTVYPLHLKGFLRFLTIFSRLSPTTPFFSAKTSHAFRSKRSTGGCDSKGSSTNLPNWKKETTIRHLKVGLVGVRLVNHVTEPPVYIYTYHNMCQMLIQWLMNVYVWYIYIYKYIHTDLHSETYAIHFSGDPGSSGSALPCSRRCRRSPRRIEPAARRRRAVLKRWETGELLFYLFGSIIVNMYVGRYVCMYVGRYVCM